jgi:hypothetical protein
MCAVEDPSRACAFGMRYDLSRLMKLKTFQVTETAFIMAGTKVIKTKATADVTVPLAIG